MQFNILFITHLLNALLICILAIGVGVFFTSRFHEDWRFYWIGAATFLLSQVGHIPFNAYALNPGLKSIAESIPQPYLWLVIGAAAGLSAGVFEETARYIMYRWWVKDARSWNRAILAGAGHGGVEALAVGALGLVAYFQLITLQSGDLAALVPARDLELIRGQVEAYWSMPWYTSFLGLVERASALVIQVALSVLVAQAFIRKQSRWFWLAVTWHALVDATAVFSMKNWGIYLTEALVVFMALASAGVIFRLRTQEAPEQEAQSFAPQPAPAADFQIKIEETPENLENTRYNS